jgi:hypothetical protein
VVKLNMELYWFERDKKSDSDLIKRANDLESYGFNGAMYPYSPGMGDFFTKISRMIDTESNFKYIVAIRTYVISPQYLSMLCSSINNISKNRVMLNFLTGYVNSGEKEIGGILSDINDNSSNILRSNHMLEYAKEFKRVSNSGYFSPVDFFISTTNNNVFDQCTKNNFPILMPYLRYKEDWFNNVGQKIILMIAPVILSDDSAKDWKCDNENECRHPKDQNCANLDFFTKDSFFVFLNECEKNGIYGILFQESDYLKEQYGELLPIVKSYIDKKSELLDI